MAAARTTPPWRATPRRHRLQQTLLQESPASPPPSRTQPRPLSPFRAPQEWTRILHSRGLQLRRHRSEAALPALSRSLSPSLPASKTHQPTKPPPPLLLGALKSTTGSERDQTARWGARVSPAGTFTQITLKKILPRQIDPKYTLDLKVNCFAKRTRSYRVKVDV